MVLAVVQGRREEQPRPEPRIAVPVAAELRLAGRPVSVSQGGVLVVPVVLQDLGPGLTVTSARAYAEPVREDPVVDPPDEVEAARAGRFVVLLTPDCDLLTTRSRLVFRASLLLQVEQDGSSLQLVLDLGRDPSVAGLVAGLCGLSDLAGRATARARCRAGGRRRARAPQRSTPRCTGRASSANQATSSDSSLTVGRAPSRARTAKRTSRWYCAPHGAGWRSRCTGPVVDELEVGDPGLLDRLAQRGGGERAVAVLDVTARLQPQAGPGVEHEQHRGARGVEHDGAGRQVRRPALAAQRLRPVVEAGEERAAQLLLLLVGGRPAVEGVPHRPAPSASAKSGSCMTPVGGSRSAGR